MPPKRSGKRSLHDVSIADTPTPTEATDASTTKPISNTFKASLERFQYEASTPPSTSPPTRSSSRIKKANTEDTSEQPSTSSKPNPHSPSSKRTTKPLQPTSPNSSSPATKKRKRESSKYAPPSKYAHLQPLTDVLSPNLICVFVGTNPGIRTATSGHAYAHPSNLFWKLLHSSGCTDRRCKPEEDVDMPHLYSMGNTNIVERATRNAGELSKQEMAEGTPILEEKFRKYRPEAVCIVGKGIWEAIWRWRHGGKNPSKEQFKWGWQDEEENMGVVEGEWEGARVFVTSSTSGLSASLNPAEKEAIWKPFGEWVKMRREERARSGEVKTEAVGLRTGDDGRKTRGRVTEEESMKQE